MQRTPTISDQRLGVMTKYWEPGKVKTRLAESLRRSPTCVSRWVNAAEEPKSVTQANAFDLASQLHRFFVFFLLKSLGNCGSTRELVASPLDRLSELAAVTDPSWQVVDQGQGDLGERMKRWFLTKSTAMVPPGKGLAPNGQPKKPAVPRRSVLIGSDCPLLDPDLVVDAFEQLENDDLVLGPASDGGYYLIGMSSQASAEQVGRLFEGIAWSTSEVLQDTLRAADQNGWKVTLLETHDDVDSVDDLDRLLARAKAEQKHAEFFNEVIELIRSGLEMS